MPVKADRHNVGTMVRADADKIRTVLPTLIHGLTAIVLTIHLAATSALTWIVFTEAFPHPVMYPLMGVLLWLFIALRFLAQYAGRNVAAGSLVAFNLALLVFWVWVLLDKVPGQAVMAGPVTRRTELPILYVPIALYVTAGVTLIAQLVVARIRRK
ncbi:MAG: hypothetical protein ISR64_00480 [Deltaproteobacteria bacterium]|nr:hypothetical protein [Deltaproteobacteria bacterium]